MGFKDVSFHDRTDAINKLQKSKMSNPYYAYTEASKSIVTYYHINKPQTTLDRGNKSAYDYVDPESPFRYDKIKEFPLYGLDKFLADLEIGDFGLNSRPIEGDALILPNTIIPNPNDFFIVDYVSEKLLFRVNNINANNIENTGNNVMYKIAYMLDNTYDKSEIDKQVINTYVCTNTGSNNSDGNGIGSLILNGNQVSSSPMTPDTGGAGDINSNYKLIIESEGLLKAKDINILAYKLTLWYIELFYNDKLEAFILKHRNQYLYDEYLTEFIIRNRIVSANEHKIHVMHQTNLDKTFSVDYESTIFRYVETRHREISDYIIKAYPLYINDVGSTLANRYYDYFKMKYIFDYVIYGNSFPTISVLDNNMLSFIERKCPDKSIGYQNIIVKYLLKEELSLEDLDSIETTKFKPNIEFFYNMPILIYILRNWGNSLLNSKTFK